MNYNPHYAFQQTEYTESTTQGMAAELKTERYPSWFCNPNWAMPLPMFCKFILLCSLLY
jgi:hypothetical protein